MRGKKWSNKKKRLKKEEDKLAKLRQAGDTEAAKKLEEQIKKHTADKEKQAVQLENVRAEAEKTEKKLEKEKARYAEELEKIKKEKELSEKNAATTVAQLKAERQKLLKDKEALMKMEDLNIKERLAQADAE